MLYINENSYDNKEKVACIGYFDGIHLGHKQLIDKTCEIAKNNNCSSYLITFNPDPWVTIKHLDINEVKHITPLSTRCEIAKQLGIDDIIVLDFSEKVCSLLPKEFEQILINYGIKTLVVGFDFTYGYKGMGNINTLKENNNINTIVIGSYDDEFGKISSSRIEKLILEGNIEMANKLLGYPFTIQGKVIKGNQVGHKLGFPTANIDYYNDQLLPPNGVYATKININNKYYYGMTNVGHNPTCNYRHNISVEINIFDFNEDIYDQYISLQFFKHTRGEKKFSDASQLKEQLSHDIKEIRGYFNV